VRQTVTACPLQLFVRLRGAGGGGTVIDGVGVWLDDGEIEAVLLVVPVFDQVLVEVQV